LLDIQKNDCVFNVFFAETLKTLTIEMVLIEKLKNSLQYQYLVVGCKRNFCMFNGFFTVYMGGI